MNSLLKKNAALFVLLIAVFFSCKDLTQLNINPNGVQPDVVNPNLIFPTVLSETGKAFVNLGFQDIAGVVQHTQKDAWFSGHNDYDWGGDQSWTAYYDLLRNNDLLYQRAVTLNLEFHQGVALVIKSMIFGLITDLWGDAPYTNALKGEQGGADFITPKYDSQETIYAGILSDLDKAATLLSKPKASYSSIIENTDFYYSGDPTKWQKLANSLKLRYLMRISAKQPDIAKAGIEKSWRILPNIQLSMMPLWMRRWPMWVITRAMPGRRIRCFDISGSNYRRIKCVRRYLNQWRQRAIHDSQSGPKK